MANAWAAVVEWKDRTGEVLIEKEVEAIVNAAARGDYGSRLVLEGKTGFFRVLSEGVNQLLGVTSQALDDIATVLGGLAQGDLTRTIKNDYEGMLGQLKTDTNATVERLRSIVGNIQEATGAINTAAQEIAAGNSNLSGRTEQQAASLEETASSMEKSPAPSGRMRRTPRKPIPWPSAHPTLPHGVAKWWAMWCPP
jgi:methyl-accepting chemotaxis protein